VLRKNDVVRKFSRADNQKIIEKGNIRSINSELSDGARHKEGNGGEETELHHHWSA
jgi:hypothetical protein